MVRIKKGGKREVGQRWSEGGRERKEKGAGETKKTV